MREDFENRPPSDLSEYGAEESLNLATICGGFDRKTNKQSNTTTENRTNHDDGSKDPLVRSTLDGFRLIADSRTSSSSPDENALVQNKQKLGKPLAGSAFDQATGLLGGKDAGTAAALATGDLASIRDFTASTFAAVNAKIERAKNPGVSELTTTIKAQDDRFWNISAGRFQHTFDDGRTRTVKMYLDGLKEDGPVTVREFDGKLYASTHDSDAPTSKHTHFWQYDEKKSVWKKLDEEPRWPRDKNGEIKYR